MRGVPGRTFGGFSVIYDTWNFVSDLVFAFHDGFDTALSIFSPYCRTEPDWIVLYKTYLFMAVEADCKTD